MEKISPSTSSVNFSYVFTPKRSVVPRFETPLQLTQKGDNIEEARPKNPFNVKAESLYLPACSPSIFATLQRKKKDDGTRPWSIEHLSVLFPADIDETSLPDPWLDEDQEKKAQKAIDTFFSQNSIVPSPWSSSPKDGKSVKARRRACMTNIFQDVQSCEASTQTMLSIPPHLDLRKILGDFYTQDEDCESSRDESDSSSSSSLRRKLFTNDDSPPRQVVNKVLISSKRRSTATIYMRSCQSTPASDILSSSPISPPNCSDLCNILSSPPISPISAAFTLKDCDICPTPPKQISLIETTHDSAMSFCLESHEIPFSSCSSSEEKQDTGYATASIGDTNLGCTTGKISECTPQHSLIDNQYGMVSGKEDIMNEDWRKTTSDRALADSINKYGFVSRIGSSSDEGFKVSISQIDQSKGFGSTMNPLIVDAGDQKDKYGFISRIEAPTDESSQMSFSQGAIPNFAHISSICAKKELLSTGDFSNSCCDMSYQNSDDRVEEGADMSSLDYSEPNKCNFQTYPWLPSCCSTPAHCFHS